MGSTSRSTSANKTPSCQGNQNMVPSLHLAASQRRLETSSSKRQCSTVDGLILDSSSALKYLSIKENDLRQGLSIPSIFNNCLPITNKEIKDNPRIPDLKFELPKTPGLTVEITTPTRKNQITSLDTPGTNQIIKITPGQEQPMKYANSTSLRLKHRRMKKHQLRRLRQKHWAMFRKKRMRRQAWKKKKFEAEIANIKKEGEDFDAEAFVKAKLAKAREGGYMINILETAQKDKLL